MNDHGKKSDNDSRRRTNIKTVYPPQALVQYLTLSHFLPNLLLIISISFGLFPVLATAQEIVENTLSSTESQEPTQQSNSANVSLASDNSEKLDTNNFQSLVAAKTAELEDAANHNSQQSYTPTYETVHVDTGYVDPNSPEALEQKRLYEESQARQTMIENYNNNESKSYDNQRFEAIIAFGFIVVLFIVFIVIILNYYKKLKPKIESTIHERQTSKAYDELLKYKKLFDENLISKEEFENRSREIKSKIPSQRS